MIPKINLNNERDGEANLSLRYSYMPNTRLKYGLGITLPVKDWDKNKQRVKRSNKYYINYNQRIEFLLQQCIEIKQKYTINKELNKLTTEKFREELNAAQGIYKHDNLSFFEFFEEYIEGYIPSTKKSYGNTLARMKEFATYYKKFDFEDFSFNWLNEFKEWCFFVRNYNPNTANKHLVRCKKVIKEAYKQKLHRNDIHTVDEFTIKKVETQHIYLTIDELVKIHNYKFDNHFDRIKDLLLVGCFTGQRISDWSKLSPKYTSVRKGKKYFNIITQKGSTEISIPVHPVVEFILEKYNYQPPVVADQHFNDEVKKLCKEVGINDLILMKEYQNGKPHAVHYEKYKLITSHTSRRSFATNMWLMGVNLEKIQTLLGHKELKTTQLYIKASAIEKAEKISEHDFFKGKSFLKVI